MCLTVNGKVNWLPEIIADTVGLWVGGPAFLSTYFEGIDKDQNKPFLISHKHPPLDVRTKALLYAAEKLSWKLYSGPLHAKVCHWKKVASPADNMNEYMAIADEDLIKSATELSLSMCAYYDLPLCTNDRIEELSCSSAGEAGRISECDIDIVILAYVVNQNSGEDYYEQWERKLLRDLR